MAAALGVITAIFMTGRQQQLLLPLVIVFIAFFSASQGTIWVYQSEISQLLPAYSLQWQ
jgi:hypothetical protein